MIIELYNIVFDFPRAPKITNEIPLKERKKAPIDKILKAFSATRNSSPNNMFRNAPGKTISNINMGRFIMYIHLPTCLLNCLILFTLFFEYSLIIKGLNICINMSDEKDRRSAIGSAAL